MFKILNLIKLIDKIIHLLLGDRDKETVSQLDQCLKESNKLLLELHEQQSKKDDKNEPPSCSK